MNEPESTGTPTPPPTASTPGAPTPSTPAPGTPPPAGTPPAASPPPPAAPSPAAQPPTPWAAPDTTAGPAPGVQWAGFGERLAGYIIDGIIISVIVTIITLFFTPFLIAGIDLSDPENPVFDPAFYGSVALLTLIVALVAVIYFPFFWVRGGKTPGMRLFSIRVVRDADGGPLSWGSAILRLIGLWVSGFVFGLGYVWVFIDQRRRGWFDLIGGTVVIKDPVQR